MANEITVPLLPCRSIDKIVEFYTMLGFDQTYYQLRPNPCVGLQREDLQLQFFGMPDFTPEDSYGSCVVLVPDTGALFAAFAAGMRKTHGRLFVSGIPRMTRPRKRKNAANVAGFTLVDPGGNWIRFFRNTAAADDSTDEPASHIAKVLQNAVVLGDSKGDTRQAARILDGALKRNHASAPVTDLVEALAYRAELALRAGDTTTARYAVTRARAVTLSEAERDKLDETLSSLHDLETVLHDQR
jgi:hypothetical protein